MKTLLNVAAICLSVALFGCESSQSTTSPANMGAVGECSKDCSASCGDKASCDKASMGAVGEKDCASSCSGTKASMGAVGDAPSCEGKKASDCGTVCPMSGKSDASLGAVSDEKASGCCKSKSSCGSTM